MTYRATFNKGEIKTAFFAFFGAFPNQRLWIADMGETEEERQKAIESLWHKFVDYLLSVEKADWPEKKKGGRESSWKFFLLILPSIDLLV